MEPIIHPIFEKQTGTWQYIVACPNTRQAVIIDPVLNLSLSEFKITTTSADELLAVAAANNYTITRLLETHAHADHLTAAFYLQQSLLAKNQNKAPISTGRRIRQVQETFGPKYAVPNAELEQAFDHLFDDDETFNVGDITAQVLHLPGHTPDHSGYKIGSNVFTGDSIFNPDVGSARCDFPNGDAKALYHSMQKLLGLPSHYKLYTGHDYPPADSGRAPLPFVTVAEQLEGNKHVKKGTGEDEFVDWRRKRDATLNEPRLLHQALQVNIRGGRLPKSSDGSQRTFLQVPFQIPRF
ncbi:metallo-beta-lactamase superfamily protein [Penicillium brasilianum]|uniref:Metallo-beta-lactamase superfamily protein n=1 Tax=Penicillium brasilianum TaxID=104259 RepID=A0A1S9RYI7_PENBI|nr:metallo-beta-lactamase superfamily protein [Penicillium brasilianum]